ncbi:hydroxymethylpyrimidine/phosphomethylpyrimidine kinase [Paraliobacillus quinghaiensis]|uniref:pyridoxal kinase n=1 Tax=Paraliobacillus quinghaiensis TaxID=470815 RepID=A0A917TRA2_9BACI|nr:bifunctional hydroxymethylpyrimidine kinase/phosphomethylpyrimidine kinase [Paraliobacillus quinghaiensis]GGM33822.1 hydroxymethylpyrimidine/phosphomethylpyrimidine kinase [Paraliobacillus quinghaiensis]
MTIKRALSIAGSAAQGSAGIQADLKTFQEHDVYGMSAVTAIVANNSITTKGIFIHDVEVIEAQYYAALEHVGVDVIKTGMLFSKEIIERVSLLLKEAPTENIVVDPVMIGKMGSQLLQDDAINALRDRLIPLAKIITPNIHEAARLLEKGSIKTVEEMKEAAEELYQYGPGYVLVKGGALAGEAIDVLYDGGNFTIYSKPRINTIHTSGAGCTYSSAIAAGLAKGQTVEKAVALAKEYVHAGINHALSFNRGIGSTDHAALRKYGKE